MSDKKIIAGATEAVAVAKGEQPAGPRFSVGTPVAKVGGDYTFEGWVVAVFAKRSGVIRYVVEDDRGVLHIYGPNNLMERTP